MFTGVDFPVASFFNQFAQRSWAFDQAVAFLSVNHLFKGGILMALVWWAWFREARGEIADRGREHMISTLLSCIVALAVVRLMIMALPYRERPLREEALGLVLPHGVVATALERASSFPSDHATLFFAVAAGMCFVSIRIGLVTLAYVALAIALPRIFLGLHYLSDIVVGAVIGAAIAIAGNLVLPRLRAIQRLKGFSYGYPQYFYPVLFLVTYQIADLFNNARLLVSGLGKLVKPFV